MDHKKERLAEGMVLSNNGCSYIEINLTSSAWQFNRSILDSPTRLEVPCYFEESPRPHPPYVVETFNAICSLVNMSSSNAGIRTCDSTIYIYITIRFALQHSYFPDDYAK